MIKIMDYNTPFEEEAKNDCIIIYGAGTAGKKILPYMKRIDYYCDKNAENIKKHESIEVIHPEEICNLQGPISILVCVNNRQATYDSICSYLNEMGINAKVFNFFHNVSFPIYENKYPYKMERTIKPLKVRIISYDSHGWILSKFAKRLEENLKIFGVDVTLGACCDPAADINHHVAHHLYEPLIDYNDTLMITHVDCVELMEQIRFQMKSAKMGICMSRETMEMLICNGIPRQKLCYITPGQDGLIKPKKFILGITHRNHECYDHRKKIKNLLELCKGIDPNYFSFLIMGDGWEQVVTKMREQKFEVEYYDQFDYDLYTDYIMDKMDYYLFFGYDEGSMGFMDALAAGIKTIVTPQGFHLDIKNGITHSCETIPDFINTLNIIKEDRDTRVRSVKHLTWLEYARKHLEVWEYLTRRKPLGVLLEHKHMYQDGIFSVFPDNIAD